MGRLISHKILEKCLFRVNPSYIPPKINSYASIAEVLFLIIYFSLLIIACWYYPLDNIFNIITWAISLFLTTLNINKKFWYGEYRIKKYEEFVKKRNNNKMPKIRKHYWNHFYFVSIVIDLVAIVSTMILFGCKQINSELNYNLLFVTFTKIWMTMTLFIILGQNIIINLIERYKAKDIY